MAAKKMEELANHTNVGILKIVMIHRGVLQSSGSYCRFNTPPSSPFRLGQWLD
jgi:hypothetical protein